MAEKQALHLKAEAGIASIRKIGCYGWNNYPVNFEFPTVPELRQMLKDNLAIKVQDLKYKKDTVLNANNFGGF